MANANLFPAQHIRHQFQRVLHALVKIVRRKGHLRRGQGGFLVRGDIIGRDQHRPVLIRADLHVAAVLALVPVYVHIPHNGVLNFAFGLLKQRNGADGNKLMHRRGQRDRRAGHANNARGLNAAGNHHTIGLNIALGGLHAPRSPLLYVNSRNFYV